MEQCTTTCNSISRRPNILSCPFPGTLYSCAHPHAFVVAKLVTTVLKICWDDWEDIQLQILAYTHTHSHIFTHMNTPAYMHKQMHHITLKHKTLCTNAHFLFSRPQCIFITVYFLILISFGCTNDEIQCFTHASQVLCHWAIPADPIIVYFLK